jgi:uncharacterized protein YjbI with pentapeptide repeats
MGDMTRDQLLQRWKRGEKLERADLRGLDLSRVQLTEAALSRSDLDGANLEGSNLQKAALRNASLREAFLRGADLSGAVLENADLEGAHLDGANLSGANLVRANLEGANLHGAKLTGACLRFAQLAIANLTRADLRGAILTSADLTSAGLGEADLSGADLRMANLTEAVLTGAKLTGAKIAGIVGTGAPLPALVVEWVDASPGGDGGARLTNGQIGALLSGAPVAAPAPAAHRYFGKGDVLKNASLQFDQGASVQIDSFFENCSIALGEGTELVLGKEGVLADCTISGGGRITIHGKFFERESPGIVGPRELTVSRDGAVVASVAQGPATRFSFHKGCQLRMKIVNQAQ